MAIKQTETFTPELLGHLLRGLIQQLRVAFKNENPDPRLCTKHSPGHSEAIIQYKGDFYKISADVFPYSRR